MLALFRSKRCNRNVQSLRNIKISISAALLGLLSLNARSQVLFSGDFAAGTGQFQFLTDYTFTLTTPIALNDGVYLVFDEAVTTVDAGITSVSSKAGTPLQLRMGATDYTRPFSLYDNYGGTVGALTPKDSFILWTSPASLSSGETLTLKAGTYTVNGSAQFNPEYNSKSFTGNLFLMNGSANAISDNVSAVPEPRDYALLTGASLAGFAMWRKRKLRSESCCASVRAL